MLVLLAGATIVGLLLVRRRRPPPPARPVVLDMRNETTPARPTDARGRWPDPGASRPAEPTALPGPLGQGLATGEAVLGPVPPGHRRLPHHPAQPVAPAVGGHGGEVDEAPPGVAQDDAVGGQLLDGGAEGQRLRPCRAVAVAGRASPVARTWSRAPAAAARTRSTTAATRGRAASASSTLQSSGAATARRLRRPRPPVPPSDWPFLDSPGVLAFAHRGRGPDAGGVAGEHHGGVRGAPCGLGYRYVETDVHATADGVLLAFHDDVLDRVTDRTGKIAELPWSEVAQARVDGGEPIPLLEDLLGSWPDLRVNIDPKHDAPVEPLAAVARAHRQPSTGCASARSPTAGWPGCASWLGPGLCTSLGPLGHGSRSGLASVGLPAGRFAAACAQVPVRQGPVPDRRRALRGRRPPAGPPGPRLDHRRRGRDGAAARPRGRRDHDRPPRGAEGRCSTAAAQWA